MAAYLAYSPVAQMADYLDYMTADYLVCSMAAYLVSLTAANLAY
jgi:hypothetical protein